MKFYLFLAAFVFISSQSFTQQVTTLIPPGSGIDDDIFVSKDGRLYCSGFAQGNLFSVVDSTVTLFSDMPDNSNGISEDSQGNIYVADFTRDRVLKIEPGGNTTTFVSLTTPSGILKMYDSDTLLVTSYNTDRIYKVAPNGDATIYLDGGLVNGAVGLVFDPNKKLFIGNFEDEKILYVDSMGSVVELCELPGNDLGFITYARNFIYATILSNHKIYRVNPQTGGFELFAGSVAGSADGDLQTATFNLPNGIKASATGDSLYVSDFGTKSIRVITGYAPPSTAINKSLVDDFDLAIVAQKNTLEIIISATRQSGVYFTIQDMQGRTIFQDETKYQLSPGKNSIKLDLELSSGMYILSLMESGEQMSQKFILK